jgi:hypothetical protein
MNPASSQQHKYITTATDYFTRWVEKTPLRVVNANQVISCLDSHIITGFGVLESLVFDNAYYISSHELDAYALEKGIKIKYFVNYYPQGNGLARSTNKNLLKNLKNTVSEHHKN